MKRYRLLMAASLLPLTAAAGQDANPGFYAATAEAMDSMMTAMHARPSGDIDRDFVTMMVPHHQAAIDMAIAELRYGSNPQLRRLAQEIIIDQQQEIGAMNLAVGSPLPEAGPAPTQQAACHPSRTL